MTFGLTVEHSGDQPFLEVDADEFEQVASAKRRMHDILYVEEKFVYLIENYYELERDLLASNFQGMLCTSVSYDEMVGDVHLFIRRVTNLLTTTRLYTDHTKRDLKAASNEGSLAEEFSTRLSRAYDSSFAYRLCEALRNYIQHSGIPLSGVRRDSRLVDRDSSDARIGHYIALMLDKKRLEVDRDLKAAVRNELANIDGRVDLRPLIREYVGHIANVHEWLHGELADLMAECEAKISDAVERFKRFARLSDDQHVFLVDDDEGHRKTSTYLATDAAHRFLRLKKKYSRLSNLGFHFVSSTDVESLAKRN